MWLFIKNYKSYKSHMNVLKDIYECLKLFLKCSIPPPENIACKQGEATQTTGHTFQISNLQNPTK